MEITYNLERRDFLTFQLFASSKSGRIRKRRKRNRIIFPLIYISLGLYTILGVDKMLGWFCFVLAILWIFFYPAYERKRYKTHYEKYIDENYHNRFGKPASLAIEEDHMLSKDHASESKFKHSEILEIYEIEEYLYAKISTGVSLIIPKRAEGFAPFKEALMEIADKNAAGYITDLEWKWE